METGCIFDGHRGQYIYGDIISLAVSHGMQLSALDAQEMSIAARDSVLGAGVTATEAVIDIANEAEEWLNEHVAEDGHSFGWFDGEYFYQPDGWWSEAY